MNSLKNFINDNEDTYELLFLHQSNRQRRINWWVKWWYLTTKQKVIARHDDVMKWKHFPCYWLFVRWYRSALHSPHKGQWFGALMFSLIFAWTVNSRDAGGLRRHRAHYDITVMVQHSHVLSPRYPNVTFCHWYSTRIGRSNAMDSFSITSRYNYQSSKNITFRIKEHSGIFKLLNCVVNG